MVNRQISIQLRVIDVMGRMNSFDLLPTSFVSKMVVQLWVHQKNLADPLGTRIKHKLTDIDQ